MSDPLQLAIVSAESRRPDSGAVSRFADIIAAAGTAGIEAREVFFSGDRSESVRSQLLRADGALVWMNPIEAGEDRSQLDALLLEIAQQGVFVSTHPSVIELLGTKEVLYTTRDLGWGCDTHLYRSTTEMYAGLSRTLVGGPRVLKRHRGSSGDGVWSVQGVGQLGREVRVRHAARGSVDEVLPLEAFVERHSGYFDADGMFIDQQFQERLREGMIRCYLVHGQVVGFGHQELNALIRADADGEWPQPGPRLYHPSTLAGFQPLKHQLETQWLPKLCRELGLTVEQLPVLWDCDFLLGPLDGAGDDSYVLCEINVSSVSPYPESAVAPIVEAIGLRLAEARAAR